MGRLLAAVVAVLLFAAPARAQYAPTVPGCPKCGVSGYVDLPSKSATVSNAELLAHRLAFEGWGFERVSGDPVNRVDLWVEDEDTPNIWHPVQATDPNAGFALTWGGYVPRPDVEAAFLASCPAIYGRLTGWIRWIDRPLPLGAHRFLILLWRGPYHADILVTLNVTP